MIASSVKVELAGIALEQKKNVTLLNTFFSKTKN
jgi:hypothetical protein